MLRTILALLLAAAAILAGACTKDSSDRSPAATAPSEPDNGLSRIEDPRLVCMVNNTYMGKAQIPVAVDGKTYFGCCPMCKERLANELDTRFAIDPATGEKVDKATAVLAQDGEGTVLYFASDQNLRNYRGAP